MNTFKKEKIKYNVTKASTRKKLIEILDTALEGGYISDEWFKKAVYQQEKELGCNILNEYLEEENISVEPEPKNIEDMSSQVELENRQRVYKLTRMQFKNLSPSLYKHLMAYQKLKAEREKES